VIAAPRVGNLGQGDARRHLVKPIVVEETNQYDALLVIVKHAP
jgi:hypothetical protein